MNKYKQEKFSTIFQTCWLAGYGGATTGQVATALADIGLSMSDKRLAGTLKNLVRRRQIRGYKNKWVVDKPFTPAG